MFREHIVAIFREVVFEEYITKNIKINLRYIKGKVHPRTGYEGPEGE
jgi:hypothetical protein